MSENSNESDQCELVTLFAIPKSFDDPHTAMIQRNAIESWTQLAPEVQVILMGAENGVAELARELSVTHVADLKTNELGTPLVNDAFARANEISGTQLIAYINCDIILLKDFVETMELAIQRDDEPFLMIGRRIDVDMEKSIDFHDTNWANKLRTMARESGELAPVVCKDYFVFRKGQFAEIPEFAVGRGNWDNWMVSTASQNGLRVIDATNVVVAIHQNHDYDHVAGGRRAAYVSGDEAKKNEKLAGGKNLVSGCKSTVRLESTESGQRLVSVRRSPFWSDLSGFMRLLKKLFLK